MAATSRSRAGGDGWTQRILTLSPKSDGIFIWTNKLYEDFPEIRDAQVGVLNLFLRATDAALTVNENADPDVRADLNNALTAIVPEDACSRASFVGVSMDIPVHGGRLALGTWQGLYLCEWASGGGGRGVLVPSTRAHHIASCATFTLVCFHLFPKPRAPSPTSEPYLNRT